MARAFVIFNPVAARTDIRTLHRVEKVFRSEGWVVESGETANASDAERLAAQAVASGVDVVAVYGGDGTAMQAVRGLRASDVPLGLIPGGTGNLLSGNMRLPRNPEKAARAITAGRVRCVDLGRVERQGGERFFAVACGCGIDADIMARTTAEAKRKWGVAAYMATTLTLAGSIRNIPYRITVDGRVQDVSAAMVLVANCGEIVPPLFGLGHDTRPDDGRFSVAVFRARGVFDAMALIGRLATRTTDRSRLVTYFSGEEVSVETNEPKPFELDGDVFGTTPFLARIEAGGLRLAVPV